MKNKYLFFLLLITLNACFSKADKIDFFLPQSFKGNCVVMYNCRDGVSPLQRDGIKQIKIPPSGVVKLKEQITYGEIKYRYFIATNKDYIQLKVYQSYQVPTSDSFYVGPGTTITNFSLDSNQKRTGEQSAFIFFVHKLGDTIPSNYNDSWIKDTLISQAKINEHYNWQGNGSR